MNEPNDPAEQQPAADECLTNARENLNQAERLFDESQGRNLDQVNAVVGIAKAWTALGAALAQLESAPTVLATARHRGPCPVGPHCRDCHMETHRIDPVTDKCTVCKSDAAQIWEYGIGCVGGRPRPDAPVTPPGLDEKPYHVHSVDCAHQWVRATEPCRECRQTQTRNQERCPVPCPEPGEWWVHLPGENRRQG